MSRSPFWNQEAVMAAGLAFAGMAMLQSKLFTIVSRLNEPFMAKLAIWWPLLLIVIGLTKVLSSNAPGGPPPANTGEPPTGPASGEVQPPSYPEVKPEVKNG